MRSLLLLLCLCALLWAVVARSVPDYGLTDTSEASTRVKRQILGSCGCPRGDTKFLGMCVKCELFVQMTGMECPKQC